MIPIKRRLVKVGKLREKGKTLPEPPAPDKGSFFYISRSVRLRRGGRLVDK